MQPLTQVYVRAKKATGLTATISTASSAPTSARPATQAVIALVASITPVVNLLNATARMDITSMMKDVLPVQPCAIAVDL